MPFPWRTNECEVRYFRGHGLFPSIFCTRENSGNDPLKRSDLFLCSLDFLGVDVADRRDFRMSFLHQPIEHVNQALAAVAETKKSNSNLGDGSGF